MKTSNKKTSKRARLRRTLTEVAQEYYKGYSPRHARRLFGGEIRARTPRHITLFDLMRRRGWRGRSLSPEVVEAIMGRLG